MSDAGVLTFISIFVAGMLTVLAPSIWPLLPLILTSSVDEDRHQRPLGVVAGVITSLMAFALGIAYVVQRFSLEPNHFRLASVLSLLLISICLLFPAINQAIQSLSRRISFWTRQTDTVQDDGFGGSLLTGVVLGLVWAPFAGPVLRTVATLTQEYSLGWQVGLAIAVYALGLALPLLLAAYWANKLIQRLSRRQHANRRLQLVFGVVTLIIAGTTWLNIDDWLVWSVGQWLNHVR